jgi:hypothetical protein
MNFVRDPRACSVFRPSLPTYNRVLVNITMGFEDLMAGCVGWEA